MVISHDHYDHLDYATIVAMKDWPTQFIVPLGVGAHLAYWGIPEERMPVFLGARWRRRGHSPVPKWGAGGTLPLTSARDAG